MQDKKLFIKIEQNIEVCNSKVYLHDVAKMYSADCKMVHELNKTELLQIKAREDMKYTVSIMKVIELIQKKYPNVDIENMGETDFVLSYVHPKKKSQAWQYVKAGFVAAIIGIGSAFSIMTFNTDVSVSDVFTSVYEVVLGEGSKSNGIVELSYSIGLPIGILVFFNHFSRKATRNDPTPLQVEMRTYEEEVNKAMIKNASREGKTIDAN